MQSANSSTGAEVLASSIKHVTSVRWVLASSCSLLLTCQGCHIHLLWKPFSLSIKHVVSSGDRLLTPHSARRCHSTAGFAEAVLQALTASLCVYLLWQLTAQSVVLWAQWRARGKSSTSLQEMKALKSTWMSRMGTCSLPLHLNSSQIVIYVLIELVVALLKAM